MNLLSTTQRTALITQLNNIWETCQVIVTIVKEPVKTPVNVNSGYIPGYGPQANPTNYTNTPESKDFYCLTVMKNPDGQMQSATQKLVPEGVVMLEVKQDCRDYILDGRKNLHAIYKGKTYNIVSEDETIDFFGQLFYIFKLSFTK